MWGASAAVLPPMLQSAAIRTSPDEAEHASALYVTAFQVGILSGSVGGGLVYEHTGAAAVVATTAVLFAVTLVGVLARGDAFRSEPTAPAVAQTPQLMSTSHVMASPPLTHPIVSAGSPGMRKAGVPLFRTVS